MRKYPYENLTTAQLEEQLERAKDELDSERRKIPLSIGGTPQFHMAYLTACATVHWLKAAMYARTAEAMLRIDRVN